MHSTDVTRRNRLDSHSFFHFPLKVKYSKTQPSSSEAQRWLWFVSEDYCHHELTRSATSGCGTQLHFSNIHPWKQSYPATRLGKLMTSNSCFNFEFCEYIGVFGYYIRCD